MTEETEERKRRCLSNRPSTFSDLTLDKLQRQYDRYSRWKKTRYDPVPHFTYPGGTFCANCYQEIVGDYPCHLRMVMLDENGEPV